MIKNENDKLILSHLRQNARIPLTKLSRKIGVPVSTLFEKLKYFERNINLRYVSLMHFQKIGYNIKVMILLKSKGDKDELKTHLCSCFNCNTLKRINNGWDFSCELIFRTIYEAEQFVEELEKNYRVKYQTFYEIDTIKNEEFLSNLQSPEVFN